MMVSADGKPMRLKRSFFTGRLVLQVQDTHNRCDSIGGSGWYDVYQTTSWRNATIADVPHDQIKVV